MVDPEVTEMGENDINQSIASPWLRRVLIFLGISSSIASILAVIFTIVLSSNANHLQRGDNTINVIAAYGSPAVRESRRVLYSLEDRNIVDPSRYAQTFAKLAPLRGALGFVATCYRDGLCLESTVIDYFCSDTLKFDEYFGSGAPDFQPVVPSDADVAFAQLVHDCREESVRQ